MPSTISNLLPTAFVCTGFEWVWDRDSKSAASDLTSDNREVRFHINYSSGTAAVRGRLPMTDRQHFWEMKMTTPVYGTDIVCSNMSLLYVAQNVLTVHNHVW